MVKEFSTFGSCSSRNIFAETSNKGYKEFFHINFSLESVTLTSLMSNSVPFNPDLLNSYEPYDNFCVKNDFTKHDFLDFLKETKLDYIVIDTYFDVLYDIIVIDENTFVSDSERLMHTDLGNFYKNNERISIRKDLIRFMDVWTKACDSFFNFINENCPDLKIILNCSRPVFKYYSSSKKEIVESIVLRNWVHPTHNNYRDILDTYILENYDVYVLPFDYTTLSNENHQWGLHPTHYEPRYYAEKTNQINEIIELEKTYGHSNKFALKLREEQRKNLILQYNQSKVKETEKQKNIELFKSIAKYKIGRIDIKNEGNESNSVDVLNSSDQNVLIAYPSWFCDVKGKGLKIESEKGNLDLKIKCINDGNLTIGFRGIDYRDKYRNRIPIYVKFTEIFINGVKINNDEKIVFHDNPVIFRKKVDDNEIITIHASWTMV